MKSRNNVTIQQKCSACESRKRGYFCDFSTKVLSAFESIKLTRSYPKGKAFFTQGQPATGIYIVCQGKAKLSIYSQDGKTVILRVAEPGEVLGLSSAMSNRSHHATAEALEPCQVNFIAKKDFDEFLDKNREAAKHTIVQLTKNYERACVQIRSLALSGSVAERFARLLLSWTRRNGNGERHWKFRLDFTHEEIGAMIGTSRETVTRLLKQFKKQKLIELDHSMLTIVDAKRLEAMTDEKSKKDDELD